MNQAAPYQLGHLKRAVSLFYMLVLYLRRALDKYATCRDWQAFYFWLLIGAFTLQGPSNPKYAKVRTFCNMTLHGDWIFQYKAFVLIDCFQFDIASFDTICAWMQRSDSTPVAMKTWNVSLKKFVDSWRIGHFLSDNHKCNNVCVCAETYQGMQALLDLFDSRRGSMVDTASSIGISTGVLSRLFSQNDLLFTAINRYVFILTSMMIWCLFVDSRQPSSCSYVSIPTVFPSRSLECYKWIQSYPFLLLDFLSKACVFPIDVFIFPQNILMLSIHPNDLNLQL